MYKKVIIVCLFLLLYFGASRGIFAISLGNLKVYSYLNEALNAEIILDNIDELDNSNILVELANPKDFIRAGIPRPFFLSKLKFDVVRKNDITLIHISTKKAVKDPLLDFLIQVTWPDGKLVKSYTILLDPSPYKDKQAEINAPAIGKQQYMPDVVNKKGLSDAIFATSLEDPMENELSLEHKKQIDAIADEVIAAAPATTSELNLDEQADNIQNNRSKNNEAGVLDTVTSSLQIFSQQPKKVAIDYEKLLDLKPSASALHKDMVPLAESLAMAQINNELDSLRNKNHETSNTSSTTNEHKEVYNNGLELMKKYGNDLLLACFLVSTTVFLFYKMMQQPSILSTESIEFTNQLINNELSPATTTTPDLKVNSKTNLSSVFEQTNLQDIPIESDQKIYQPHALFSRNEELELKIELARQYIEAGDRHSAKSILQDFNTASIKEPRYREQIDSLLKCLA